MKTMRMTDEQINTVHKYLLKKYPFLNRENIAYQAELISYWDVRYNERYEDDIKEALAR